MKILQLTPFPTANPISGGQIRCHQIARTIAAAGHDVESVAIYLSSAYPNPSDIGENDIAFGPSSVGWSDELLLNAYTDYYLGLFAIEDEAAFSTLRKIVAHFKPDLLWTEHPWLYRVACKLADSPKRVVHSSHNVEWRLKRRLLERMHLPSKTIDDIVDKIQKLEQEAARDAGLTIACTSSDADYFRQVGGALASVVVAGNAVEPFSCAESRVASWRTFLSRPTATLVSSSFIPNVNGFWDMMAPGLAFLRPEEKILVIGTAKDTILEVPGSKEFSLVNRERMLTMGVLEKVDMQAAIRASHVILLPTTDGEGSNLKTAEALESSNYVVGTSRAFRGYEDAVALDHVHIADDAPAFRRKVRELLDAPPHKGGTPWEIRSRYYWANQLYPVVKFLDGYRA